MYLILLPQVVCHLTRPAWSDCTTARRLPLQGFALFGAELRSSSYSCVIRTQGVVFSPLPDLSPLISWFNNREKTWELMIITILGFITTSWDVLELKQHIGAACLTTGVNVNCSHSVLPKMSMCWWWCEQWQTNNHIVPLPNSISTWSQTLRYFHYLGCNRLSYQTTWQEQLLLMLTSCKHSRTWLEILSLLEKIKKKKNYDNP